MIRRCWYMSMAFSKKRLHVNVLHAMAPVPHTRPRYPRIEKMTAMVARLPIHAKRLAAVT